ncbi:Methyltransferase [Euzebya pacifica]|jgi:ubiquinone/menaquinone biosynthesis C-methylase UbiE|uniref:Methyltransferase n=1 Tax=Euzebya pacifica TaxID=1608957 RepID=A0A346XY62_9ACTN|nr:class I SAM-dependent methyltransferase [Euzebya pacifica]AXV07159.1 Methyltransferase [Euzebya pacifica]
MRMNRTETVLVNSPPRRWLQRVVEAPVLLRLGGRMAGGTALELGCGRGAGIELILDRFGADRVIGFDLDEAMVARARRRLAGRSDVDVRVGDAVAIDLPDASVDAVFDFAIIHHVPDWRTAVGEIRRVLRPGGRLYYSEVTKHALDRPTYRVLFDHPDHDRFTASDFVAALEDHDLRVGDRHRTLIAGDYALGVAERMPHSPF